MKEKNAIDLYKFVCKNDASTLNQDVFIKWVAITLKSQLELLAVACEFNLEGELYYLKTGLFESDRFRLKRKAFDGYSRILKSALEKLSEAAKMSVALDEIDGYPAELNIIDAFNLAEDPELYGTTKKSDRQLSYLVSYMSEMESLGSEVDAEYEDYLELLFELNDESFEPEYEEGVQEAQVVIELSA